MSVLGPKHSPVGSPPSDDVEFFTKGGRVHVLASQRSNTIVDMLAEPGEDFDATAVNLLLGHSFVGRCGVRISGAGTPEGPWTTDQFNDDRLCVRCMRATPDAERHRLFEHPQDEEDDDDGEAP